MKRCLYCDRPIVGPGVFRIRIGGVTYDDVYGAQFVQSQLDYFRDHTKTKWLCADCAAEREVFIDELEKDACRAPEGLGGICGNTFEPIDNEDQSECVLLFEWGVLQKSAKGPGEVFIADEEVPTGHVHFNCACEGWELPFWSIEARDEP